MVPGSPFPERGAVKVTPLTLSRFPKLAAPNRWLYDRNSSEGIAFPDPNNTYMQRTCDRSTGFIPDPSLVTEALGV